MIECLSAAECAWWLRRTAGENAALRVDSRLLESGDVFVALKGEKADGLSFAPVAAARRAAALICDKRGDVLEKCAGLPCVEVENLRENLGVIASLFYGEPSKKLHGVAVTGTNGKTSSSHWTAALLTDLGMPAAAIGTVGTYLAGRRLQGPGLTTPDAATLQLTLKHLLEAGARAFAVEASSIGLVRRRLDGTAFETAVFTNLTRDHLDYHKTFEAYEAAKAMLFAWPDLKCAVINADDEAGRRLIARTLGRGIRTIAATMNETLAIEGCEMLTAKEIVHEAHGMRFTLVWDAHEYTVMSGVVGRFNVSNLLSAAGAAISLGFAPEAVCAGLERLRSPAGRMQTVTAPHAPLAVVDYAHTPDALEKVLSALRETAQGRGGRLIGIFGAGGDRDPGKRPIMGEVVSRLADRTVITSDNPRTEEPEAIARAIARGVPESRRATVSLQLDRRGAIVETLCAADEKDVVLIAGKGHEDYQEINGVKHHFDDLETAREAFNERLVRTAKQ